MTYKEKLTASEHRAHNQNIATKILRDLADLRSKVENSATVSRRWIWELIQNAKDVHNGNGVSIKIDYRLEQNKDKPSHITFKHTGKPFTADNIRFLIEQISTKDRSKDEEGKRKTTGKFGTGFLTTHLLSEQVKIEAIAKEPELDYRRFTLYLDRTGFDIEAITESVEKAKKSVENLDDLPTYKTYAEGNFNTSFQYILEDSIGIQVAKSGLNDLENCLPYTLLFVDELEAIQIEPEERVFKKTQTLDLKGTDIKIVSIDISNKIDPLKSSISSFALLSKGFTSIAIPIAIEGSVFTILPIKDQVPRLFCDFPLIGTENFPFPTIINNPHFNPTDPRDGIFLTSSQRANPQVEENKAIIIDSTEIYFRLLKFASENNWNNLYILAQINNVSNRFDWLDQTWFRDNIVLAMRKELLHAKIFNTASDGELASILTEDNEPYILFPASEKREIRERIWESAKHWFPHCLPRQNQIDLYFKLSWHDFDKLTVDKLALFIENQKNLETLSSNVTNQNIFDWLNDFYDILKLEEKEYDTIINKRSIFPNQNGLLCKKAQLSNDKNDIGDDFKDILTLLGRDIRAILIHSEINSPIESDKIVDLDYATKNITAEISAKVHNRQTAKLYSKAFNKLLLWFRSFPNKAEILFPTLYTSKHLLYDDEEILDNISKSEQLSELLTEFQANNVEELRTLLSKGIKISTSILPVTQEILVSMGITSLEEWQEAIKDKDLSALFSHESTPTTDMFIYAQSLIHRAKSSIIKHLQTLQSFDLTHMEETAPTVLGGILKDGSEISIVARPAYDGEVIIYYGSERDILDFEPSELWVDDGKEPRNITIGRILKQTNIRKFPV